jgi:hypothetical protein
MSSSVSNKVHADDPKDEAAMAKGPANGGAVLKNPANDEAAAAPPGGPANANGDGGNAPPELVNDLGGGGGGGKGGVTRSLPIEVTMPGITYDENCAMHAGYLKVDDDDLKPLAPYGGTVLRLLCYLTYTGEGRTLLLSNAVDSDAARATLKAALRKKFPALEDDRLGIALDAHFAAGAYVRALDANDPNTMGQQQAIYTQKLLAILGALYDDAMGRDFSCVW